jgi:hypothetical protein
VHVPVPDVQDNGSQDEERREHECDEHRHLAAFARSNTTVTYDLGVFGRPNAPITTDVPQRNQPLSFPARIIPLSVLFATLGR